MLRTVGTAGKFKGREAGADLPLMKTWEGGFRSQNRRSVVGLSQGRAGWDEGAEVCVQGKEKCGCGVPPRGRGGA